MWAFFILTVIMHQLYIKYFKQRLLYNKVKDIQAAGWIESYWISHVLSMHLIFFRKIFLKLMKTNENKVRKPYVRFFNIHLTTFSALEFHHRPRKTKRWECTLYRLEFIFVEYRVMYILRWHVYMSRWIFYIQWWFFLNCIASDLDFSRFMQEIKIYSRWASVYSLPRAECKRMIFYKF